MLLNPAGSMVMIPLFKPCMPDELPEMNNILHSGALSYGKWGKLFEAKLGEYIGNKQILAVNSFNSAMLVVITTLGLKPGDEVIASPMSCLASNQPFATQNLKVVWADIDPYKGTLDPDSVKLKITSKTKAIFHNHFCGYAGYIDEINTIGKEKGIFIIDDGIEAFGTQYKGKLIGNTGADATVFSFQTVRLPNTVEGGAISFKSEVLNKKAVLVRDYGIDRNNFRNEQNEINPYCDITISGFGATLSEINSYIGYLQMKNITELISVQRNNAKQWLDKLAQDKEVDPILTDDYTIPNYWIFGLLSENKIDSIIQFRKQGYYASGVHLPNNFYSVFGKQEELRGVNEFYSKFLAIPCGWWL